MTSPTRFALFAVLIAGAVVGGCNADRAAASAADIVEDIGEDIGENEVVDDAADVDDPPDGEDADPSVEDAAEPDVETDIEAPDARDDDTITDVADEELPDTGEDPAEDPQVFDVSDTWEDDVENDPDCHIDCFGGISCTDGISWEAPYAPAPCWMRDWCRIESAQWTLACSEGCGSSRHWCAEDQALLTPADGAELFSWGEAPAPAHSWRTAPLNLATSNRRDATDIGALLVAVDVLWDFDSGASVVGSSIVRDFALAAPEIHASWVMIRGERYDLQTGTVRLPDPPFARGFGSDTFFWGEPDYTALSIVGQTADGTTVSAGWGWTEDGSYTAWALVEPAP